MEISAKKGLSHLKTINEHKWEVMKLLAQAGLYRQALAHDLSKYSWQELEAGFKYYQGNRSANDGQKRKLGYSPAWLHHKGRNKHHWHYWLDFNRDGLYPIDIPYRYIVEMFCDRIAACRVYQKDKYTDASPYEYFKNGEKIIVMTDSSKAQLEELLTDLKDHGLEHAMALARRRLDQARKEGRF